MRDAIFSASSYPAVWFPNAGVYFLLTIPENLCELYPDPDLLL